MKNKKFNVILVTTILILTQFISFGLSQKSEIESDNLPQYLKISSLPTVLPTKLMKSEDFDVINIGESSNFSNIIVAGDTGDESYPSFIMNRNDALVAYEYDENNMSNIYFRNSDNYGLTWSNPEYFPISVNATSPSLIIKKDSNKAFGTFVSLDKTYNIYEIHFEDISNSNTWNGYFTDWFDFSFWGFSNPDITIFPDSKFPWVIGLIGSTNFTSGPCKNSPMFTFPTPENPNNRTIAWFPTFENCSNISIGLGSDVLIQDSTAYIFGVCEIKNGTNQDLLFFKGNPNIWYYQGDKPLNNQTFTGIENLTHPQIYVKDTQIYIIAETDANASKEIILFSSFNAGENWTRYNITKDILPANANPQYPSISVDEPFIYCIFMESGNLSLTNSSDYGFNWTTPAQINEQNNTVVEEYRFAEIFGINYVIWTDNRNGNNDIYASFPTPPIPDLLIISDSIQLSKGLRFIPTKNRLSYTIKNNGERHVEDIPVSIIYTCDDGIQIPILEQGYITYLDGFGAQKTYQSDLFKLDIIVYVKSLISFAGIVNITIEVDPDGISGDTNTINNIAIKDVSYQDIFPTMSRWENLFKRFK